METVCTLFLQAVGDRYEHKHLSENIYLHYLVIHRLRYTAVVALQALNRGKKQPKSPWTEYKVLYDKVSMTI